MKIKRSKAGGLSLATAHDSSLHSIAVMLAFPAGAMREKEEERGLAHFLEHMVFRGSEEYPDRDSVIDAFGDAGLFFNAFTGYEMVAYHAEGSPESVNDAIRIISGMVASPTLREEDIALERKIIGEEIKGFNDNPDRSLWELAAHSVWPGSKRDAPILGYPKTLRKITSRDLARFQSRHYKGGGFFLAGDLRHLDRSLLRERSHLFREGTPTGYRRLRVETGVAFRKAHLQSSHLALSWPLRRAPDERQSEALEIWTSALRTRLFKEVREKEGLCYSISPVFYAAPAGETLTVVTSVEHASIAKATEKIRQEVEEAIEGNLSEKDIDQARKRELARELFTLSDPYKLAMNMAYSKIVDGRNEKPTRRSEIIRSLSTKEILQSGAILRNSIGLGLIGPERPRSLGKLVE